MGVQGLERPKLEYPALNWDKPWKPKFGENTTGSRFPREQELEHSHTRPPTPFNPPSFSVPATPPDLYLVTRNSPRISQALWENFLPDQLFPEGSGVVGMQNSPPQPAGAQWRSLREFNLEEHAKMAKGHITAMNGVVAEGPVTDSGYASIFKTNISRNGPPLPDKPQCLADDKSNVKMRDEDTEDAKTLYSAATTIDLPKSQQYISELCSDIFSKLENHFDSTNWNTLETALPSLIKAFAIKIGHDSSAKVNQDIMYFIHKQHK